MSKVGRPFSGKVTIPVRCYNSQKVIKDVRKYAKERSEQEFNKEKNRSDE